MNSSGKLYHIQSLLKSHQTEKARTLIDELIDAEPSNIEVCYWRGVCETFEGEFDLAENDFRSVIRQKPNHQRAFYGLGKIFENKGKLKDAISAYQQAASLGNKEAAKKLAQYKIPVDKQQTVAERASERKLSQQLVGSTRSVVDLKSEKGINYNRLRDLLVARKWQNADEETEKLMYRAAGRNQAQWGETFPCTDLKTIDNLWTHYSQGRFGFSVQHKIWQRRVEGGKKFHRTLWGRFGSCVGWLDRRLWLCKSELSFDESAPKGHLPARMWAPLKSEVDLSPLEAWWILQAKQMKLKAQKREAGWHGAALIELFSRLENCNLHSRVRKSQQGFFFRQKLPTSELNKYSLNIRNSVIDFLLFFHDLIASLMFVFLLFIAIYIGINFFTGIWMYVGLDNLVGGIISVVISWFYLQRTGVFKRSKKR